MAIIANKDSPMLRRVRVVVGLLCDVSPQTCLLCEPLAAKAAYGMPPDLDLSVVTCNRGVSRGYDVRFMSQPNGMLQRKLALEVLRSPLLHQLFSAMRELLFP